MKEWNLDTACNSRFVILDIVGDLTSVSRNTSVCVESKIIHQELPEILNPR